MTAPILLSLDFTAESEDVVRSATALAKAIHAPLVAVHSLGWVPLESSSALETRMEATRDKILEHLAPAIDEGVTVFEPIVRRGRPDEEALLTAAEVGAQLIVTGGGGPATVRRWVLGSVAERIVRGSPVPVFIARGALPMIERRPVLCPIDLSPHSRVGLHAAIRMARAFGSPLVTLTVIPEEEKGWLSADDLEHALAREEHVAATQVKEFIGATDLADLEVEHRVVIGQPAKRIVEAAEEAWLMVIASRGFTQLRATSIGGVTEQSIRLSRCSLYALRDTASSSDHHEAGLRVLARLVEDADAKIAEGDPARALTLLELASIRAPANAMVQEKLAAALEALGRTDEAHARRSIARVIRDSFA